MLFSVNNICSIKVGFPKTLIQVHKIEELTMHKLFSDKLGRFWTNCWDCAVRLFPYSLTVSAFRHWLVSPGTSGWLKYHSSRFYNFSWRWAVGFREGSVTELMPTAALQGGSYPLPLSMELWPSCNMQSPPNQMGRLLKRRMEVVREKVGRDEGT